MDKKPQITRFLFYFLLLLPLMVFRDLTVNNELKYLSIVNESLQNGHFWTMFNQGVAYADKPPLYFWIIMGLKLLFGKHINFAIALFSLIPAFITLYIMNIWCGKELKGKYVYASEIALLTSVFFIGSAIVVRMDMMMTMFITLSMWTFYRMFTGDDRLRLKIAFPIYIFLALFSKGPVGIMVPLFVIPVWLLVCGKIKDFFHYWSWRTWLILAILCAGWFTAVYLEGGTEYLNNLLFHQTIDRAVDSFHHKEPFYYYGIAIWYSLAPWSVLTIGVIIYGLVKKVRMSTLTEFMLVSAGTIILMMSIVSSKIQIYILPSFAFLTYGAFLILQDINPKGFSEKARKVVVTGAQIIFVLYFIAGCSVWKFNDRIGYRNICREALADAAQYDITDYRYYDIRTGGSLDVFMGNDVTEITREEFDNPESIIMPDSNGVVLFYKDNDRVTYKIVKRNDASTRSPEESSPQE